MYGDWSIKPEEQASFEKEIKPEIIIPFKQLGQTVPEQDPRTGANILQNVSSAIRGGAGTIQLAMTVNPQAAMGGRPKGYGKEVRQALREMLQASKVTLEGLELPTQISNVTGLQEGGFDEHHRSETLKEVHDSMRFLADVARGGGVDIFSQEFPRALATAKWNENKNPSLNGAFKSSETETEDAPLYLVDDRTGKVVQGIRRGDAVPSPEYLTAKRDELKIMPDGSRIKLEKNKTYVDYQGNPVSQENRVPAFDQETGTFKVVDKKWDYYVEEAKKLTAQERTEFVAKGKKFTERDIVTPEEALWRQKIASEGGVAKAWAMSYAKKMPEFIEKQKELNKLQQEFAVQEKNADNATLNQLRREAIEKLTGRLPDPDDPLPNKAPSQLFEEPLLGIRREIEEVQNMSVSQQLKERESEAHKEHVISIDKYAKEKAFDSYAKLGMTAFEETMKNPNITGKDGKMLEGARPLFVGPENGWPTTFGGHPDEFIEIITKSREKMQEELINKKGFAPEQAKETAETHIKGLFDTGHLGMFFQYFHPKDDKGNEISHYDKRLELFNKWYLEQVEKMAKAKVIGSVQAVDSMGGAHAHLPAGQGIFPVVEAVKILKKKGDFNGFVISEGHEEEGYGPGRILSKTWEAFGGPITGSYTMPLQSGPRTWGQMQQGYFGR
ncbi:MAG: hypothetical protein Q7K43_04505, partial [Candidatus Woesearchaeota archaeon]|nr:hypothetical protein [Candidatus Woesearchaeota archaeon]